MCPLFATACWAGDGGAAPMAERPDEQNEMARQRLGNTAAEQRAFGLLGF